MKKYSISLLCAALSLGFFTACEDVPAPYNIPTEDPTPVVTPAEPKGTGTLEDPFNAVAATQAAKALESGAESEQDYYIQGIVSSVADSYSTNFGNASFYISDDGTASNQFYVYRALYLGNQKYTSGENIEAGDTVIICGKITNYRGNTPETVQNKAYLYSLKKGDGTSSQTPVENLVGSGTIEDPYTSASALLIASALTSGGQTRDAFYIKGKVVSVKEQFSTQYGNASFYISDDGTTTDQFYIFRSLYLGNKKWTSGDKQLKEGDEVIICAKLTNYMGNTPETVQGSTYIYSLNGETGGVTPTPGPGGDAKGTGTLEDPLNAVAANNIASALGSGGKTDQAYYIKGKVVSVKEQFSAQYGNASFYISDDGTTAGQFYIFRALYLGNQKWANGDKQLKEGDEVIVYAKLTNYMGNTPETLQGETYLYSLNGETAGGTTPTPGPSGEAKGTGSLADPYNSVAANNIASALASGAKTSEAYYIKGKVVSVKEQFSAQYGNASFYISDDGTSTDQFYVFRALYFGNQKWVSGNSQIKAGDEVVVYAKLTNYMGNTPETAQGDCYIYSINGKTEDDGTGGGDTPGPGTGGSTLADFTNGDFETWADGQPTGWKSASTASNATLSQSNDAHGGSYSVKVGGASQNKRLAYKELELEAGTYDCSFWTKAATSSVASLCPGYAAVGSSITYYYDKMEDDATKNKYVNNIGQEWQQVKYSFTLPTKTTVCLVVMNSKTTGTDLLIDDFTITKK